MTSKKRKLMHKQAEQRASEREYAERTALLKPEATSQQREERFRIFMTLALFERMGGSLILDFGIFNEAYWSEDTLQAITLKAQALEAEFLRTGVAPEGFFNVPPLDPYDESCLEYGPKKPLPLP